MDRLDYAIRDITTTIMGAEKEIKELMFCCKRQMENTHYNQAEILKQQANGIKTYQSGLKRALEIMENLGMDK